MNNLEEYYQTLELNPTATKKEVKKAYRQLAKKWHPDHHRGDEKKQKIAQQKFVKITEAYHVLYNNIPESSSSNTPKEERGYTTYNIDATYFYELGVEAAEKEDWQEAVNYFSQAIKMDDSFSDAHFYRGIALEKQGFELRAKSDFDKFNDLKNDRLDHILQQVINNLESLVAKQYSRQGLKLVHIIDDIALLKCKSYHYLSGLEDKKADFEQAFTIVCDRPIQIKFELEEKKIKTTSNSQNKRKRTYRKVRKRYSSTVQNNPFVIGLFIIIAISLFTAINQRNNNRNQSQFSYQKLL